MDSTFDFFTYENQNNHKFETLFDQDFSLSSPFSEHSDSTGIFPNFLPKTIKNLLDVDEGTPSDLMKRENDMYNKKTKPFQIIKQKKEPSPEHSEFTEPAESVSSYNPREVVENKIGTKSKRILKQEKPKEKIKFKQDAESIMRRVDRKYIPEGFDDPELDEHSKKKMVQMIRNRVSAQSSRDKKKMYLHHLEEMKEELELENEILVKDKSVLQERIQTLEYEKAVLIQENENLKKNTSYLCSKCGCTLEYEEPPGNKNVEYSDSALASPVGLSRRHSTSKNFFGFSLGFAAVLCVLFVMSGGLGIVPSRHTVLVSVSRYEPIPNADVCINNNQISNEPFEEVANEGEASDQYGLFDVIGSLISKVRRLPDTYFQSSGTKQNKYVNPPKIHSSENKLVQQAEYDKTTPEEDKISSAILQNKSSLHFCPSDFESYKSQGNMGISEEEQIKFIDAENETENLPNRLTVDLERNDFVRVVLHKNSINRLNVPENTYEIANMRIYQAPEIPEEGNPWIEVWCKIFAIRDVATF